MRDYGTVMQRICNIHIHKVENLKIIFYQSIIW